MSWLFFVNRFYLWLYPQEYLSLEDLRWFPGGSVGKESARNAGDLGSIPGLGRSPGEGNSYPLQYSGLKNSRDRGAWQAIQSMGWQRVGHNWEAFTFTLFPWQIKAVFLSCVWSNICLDIHLLYFQVPQLSLGMYLFLGDIAKPFP